MSRFVFSLPTCWQARTILTLTFDWHWMISLKHAKREYFKTTKNTISNRSIQHKFTPFNITVFVCTVQAGFNYLYTAKNIEWVYFCIKMTDFYKKQLVIQWIKLRNKESKTSELEKKPSRWRLKPCERLHDDATGHIPSLVESQTPAIEKLLIQYKWRTLWHHKIENTGASLKIRNSYCKGEAFTVVLSFWNLLNLNSTTFTEALPNGFLVSMPCIRGKVRGKVFAFTFAESLL